MSSKNFLTNLDETPYYEFIGLLIKLQDSTAVQMVRKEGEVFYMIKQEPLQPVKYYMNKSGMSARWFNEILKQLLAAELVAQETCSNDSRRKLLS